MGDTFAVLGFSFFAFCLPTAFIWSRSHFVTRTQAFLAIGGFYCLAGYLKPVVWPAYSLIPLIWLFALSILIVAKKRDISKFFSIELSGCVLLAYSFLLFLWIGEPPGTDPTKWGTLARLFVETGAIPGDTRPITTVVDLKGASMGIPILIAQFPLTIGWEKAILFLECLSVACFAAALSDAAQFWVAKKTARWIGVIALILFTVPQQYLAWGGTPTLMGMTAGFILMSLGRQTKKGLVEICLGGLALSFAAHCHPIGFTSSIVIAGVCLLPMAINKDLDFKNGFLTIIFAGICFLPFLLSFGFDVQNTELQETWKWQKTMSPFLFRSEYSVLYNLYIQVSTYLWNTAFWVGMLSLILSCIKTKNWKTHWGLFLAIGVIALWVLNVMGWWLPLSFLWYPDRIATLLVFPLAVGIGSLWETLINYPPMAKRALLGLVLILGARQWTKHILPHLSYQRLTQLDRDAISKIAQTVPSDECIGIDMNHAGVWIPVLAYRCTQPFHGLGMNTRDTEKPRKVTWVFNASKHQKKSDFDNAAQLTRLKDIP